MTMAGGHGPALVRRRSIRVAAAATLLVAFAYLVLAVAVVLIVSDNLTGQIDGRLTAFLGSDAVTSTAGVPGGGSDEDGHGPYDSDRPFGPPTLVWRIAGDGTTTYIGPSNYAVDLPAAASAVITPQTVTINGTSLRIAGRQVGAYHVVAAQSLLAVRDAQGTIILAELVIAPFLLLAVLFGAIVIGRRVATPIEAARQRQLEFTADASHELRTPLAVIEANTSLALARERSGDWYRTAFTRIDSESRRMRRLLEDLLWLARFDATGKPADQEPVDLGILAAAAADRFDAIAEARTLTLTVDVPAESLVITAPVEWIDRLLGVLLDNACKYSPDGGRIHVDVRGGRTQVTLTIDDSGPGIPVAERSRIFDRFHRATEARSGAGLGLAIGDAIVKATGGEWRIGDAPGGGARMSVTWPRSMPAEPRRQPAERPRPDGASSEAPGSA